MRIATVNFYQYNKTPVQDLERLDNMNLDVIGFQEMWRHIVVARDQLKNHRLRWGKKSTNGAREVASAIHKRYEITGSNSALVSPASVSEETKWFKPRYLNVIRFKKDGQRYAHLNYHGNAVLQSKNSGNNLLLGSLRVLRWVWAQQKIERRIKSLQKRGFIVFVTGDFNYRRRSDGALPYFAPQNVFDRCNLRWESKGVDYVAWSKPLKKTDSKVINKETTGSDHDWLVITLD